MYPIFYFLSVQLQNNWRIAWLIGLMIYWLIWGIGFPLLTIGHKKIVQAIIPRKFNLTLVLLVLFLLIMTTVFKWIPGSIQYEKSTIWTLVILIFSAFGNGFFEEIYWRGTFMILFPKNIIFRIIWPSIGFALWHYVPGSVNPDSSHIIGLMSGALFLGFYSGFLAWKSNSIWWSILAHVLGGLIIIV
jgi:membrane protease YdiL (CAAX protease family)